MVPFLIVLCAIVFGVLLYIWQHIFVVHGQTALVTEQFGVPIKRALYPGLRILLPFRRVVNRVDLKQTQIERNSQVKTQDDAFLSIQWVVRFSVKPTDEAILAYTYKVADPVSQLIWRVENELRQIIHSMTLQDLYAQKDQISQRIIGDQAKNALETGMQIDDVVIEQPMPPPDVMAAMNNQIAALSRQKAAAAEAEAERLRRVGLAKAESESKELQGQGIAKQRLAIATGFKESFELMQEGLPSASSHEIMTLMHKTIEADMVSTASADGKSTIIFIPTGMTTNGSAGSLASLATQLSSEQKAV
ncbi:MULTISPECIES: SPFH domain-containing protein [unclassified Saccharibacter]|uniref:SPFH domain-containing protein n=1 Tax=unclassified Saccharibacter TaxID=2648722 RepID=UPI001327A3F3|nr:MULTISPECIES: SPFH domain-containing protein [unclassified Saccharibacter]MXV35558.1 hypothetical protein [Saccharibacter sp. EH611]MXV58897.1 hypothetical protein [Saccharibacter sp. EH70]MXV65553.1 hypothetical protein [Saccharibacter sp. EH60]